MKVGNFKVSSINTEARKNFSGRSGDTVRVSIKIKEGDKSRIQDFEGIITARKHGAEPGATFTVRKIASGVGVERIFPLYSPVIDSIEIKKRGRARKSKLYFIKEKAQREISRKMKSEVVNEKAIRNDDVEAKAEAIEAK